MKKKGLILLLCLALVSVLAVNGTFAQEAETLFKNLVQTLGEVFGMPEKDESKLRIEILTSENPVLLPANYPGELPQNWESLPGTVMQTISAVNRSTVSEEFDGSAYVCLAVAVKQHGLLHTMLMAEPGYTALASRPIQIGGEAFNMVVFCYDSKLAANAELPRITLKMLLEKTADNTDMAALGANCVQVKALAVDTRPFDPAVNQQITKVYTPFEALDEALGLSTFNPFN